MDEGDGPDSDIVFLSSRIRLARNFKQYQFSMQNEEEAQKVQELFKKKFINKAVEPFGKFGLLK